MEKREVIFDCDIGCDDAIALIALLLSDKVDVKAITCVRGNLPVECVADNALKVTELLNKDIPVYVGCKEAMVRTLIKGRDYNTLMERIHMVKDGEEILIHQKSFDLPAPKKSPEDKHACTYIIETLKNMEVTNLEDMCYASLYQRSKVSDALEEIYKLDLDRKYYQPKELSKKIRALKK